MQARCSCTLEKIRDGVFKKPQGGFKSPNLHCVSCGGKGFTEVSFPQEDEVEAVWIGVCPLCSSQNGVHLQLKGWSPPSNDGPRPCINEKCPNESVRWVHTDDLA